jgi:hypothetical protein
MKKQMIRRFMKKALLAIFMALGLASLASAQGPVKASLSVQASSTCATASSFLLLPLTNAGGATFTITANASANTISFFGSVDGSFWAALNATPSNGTTAVTTTTTTGIWQANVSSYNFVCAEISSLVSGTTTVIIQASSISARSGGGGGSSAFPQTVTGGVSGGIPCFTSTTTEASSVLLTANLPVIGGGAGACPTVGTRTGNTTQFPTWTGATTSTRCVDTDANGNLQITATDCPTTGLAPVTNTSSVTVPNPTINTDTILMDLPLSANYLNTVGTPFYIHGSGVLSTTAASVPQVTITAKICSVSGCASGTVTPLAAIQSTALNTTALTNAGWNYDLIATVVANGASCNLIVKGAPGLTIDTGASTTAADSVFAENNTGVSSPNQTCTNALFLDFFVQQTVAGASNSYKQLSGLIAPFASAAPNQVTGVAGSRQFNQGASFAGTVATLQCNSSMAGADWGAKANTCLAALPATGGVADMSELKGTQTLGTAVAIPANDTLYCGAGTNLSQTAAVTLPNVKSAFIGSPDQSCVITKAANLDQIAVSISQTSVQNLTLVGVGGSFTGNGITVTSFPSFIINNNISGEATSAINDSGGSTLLLNNLTGGTAAGPTMSVGSFAIVTANTVTANAGDGIDLNGNDINAIGNIVKLTLTSAVSNFCGISAKADQIGDRVIGNQIQISDTHNADINYGVCDAPTGTHNLNMLFEGNDTTGLLSGGATADGDFLNNAANLNTNWSVKFVHEGCVHLTFCTKRTDTQNNITIYEDIQPGDVTLDAGTGSTNDTWILHQRTAIASLPTPTGLGSTAYVTDCTPGPSITGSGTGCYAVYSGGVAGWHSVGTSWSTYVTVNQINATTTPANLMSTPVVTGTFKYSAVCPLFYSSAATGGLNITATIPSGTIIYSLHAPLSASTFNDVSTQTSGTTIGAVVTTASTIFPAVLYISVLSPGTGTLQIQFSSSAAVANGAVVYAGSNCSWTTQ